MSFGLCRISCLFKLVSCIFSVCVGLVSGANRCGRMTVTVITPHFFSTAPGIAQWNHTIITRAADKPAVAWGPGVAESRWSGRRRAASPPTVRIRARPYKCCTGPSLPSSAGGGQRPASPARARCGKRAAWANARPCLKCRAQTRQKTSFRAPRNVHSLE